MSADYERVQIASIDEWRTWLHAHHAESPGIWLVTFKKSKGPYVAYDDVVDEAICFGWIDSQPRTLDADRSLRLVTPRRRGSSWSAVNKRRVERLAREARLRPAGMAAIEAARADGSWSALDAVETLTEPDDLRVALDADQPARANWDAFPRSTKRAILEWISTAKAPSTRSRRITTTVSEAAAGRRANQWRRPTSGQ